MQWDVFVSYASEDRANVAQPLAEALIEDGLSVWYDQFELKMGDSLRRKLDEGLTQSKYGIVVLSPSFFSKHFTNLELDGLAQREVNGKKVILPVWYNVTAKNVRNYSPTLADRIAASWESGIDVVIKMIKDTVQPQRKIIKQAQKKKLEGRKNTLLNSTVPSTPEESLQQMFVNFANTFITAWHLQLLKLFHAPVRQNAVSSGALSHVVEEAFPELRGRRGFYDQIWRDLYAHGLVNTESLHGLMTSDGLVARRTTDLGAQFLEFIENSSL